MSTLITIFSRHGCHLCEVAEATLTELKKELEFEIEVNFIDGDVVESVLDGGYDRKLLEDITHYVNVATFSACCSD